MRNDINWRFQIANNSSKIRIKPFPSLRFSSQIFSLRNRKAIWVLFLHLFNSWVRLEPSFSIIALFRIINNAFGGGT